MQDHEQEAASQRLITSDTNQSLLTAESSQSVIERVQGEEQHQAHAIDAVADKLKPLNERQLEMARVLVAKEHPLAGMAIREALPFLQWFLCCCDCTERDARRAEAYNR